jgi:hypothetical protein
LAGFAHQTPHNPSIFYEGGKAKNILTITGEMWMAEEKMYGFK